ncbi:hypothetical protein NLJ89_g11330 [Agrocybe chaxingu]|uniref:Uncharacterized protein n=1 Tax=Agrocybe chaxingu TaxID=84603 RepID=A0A9W8JQ64_9AGAR|nr:hypothetical protein NLJ89_g11330 [Agrocybe chaxingu]
MSDTTHSRSPKSANEWTADDLRAYNISVFSVPPSKFFPSSSSPTSLNQVVDPAILTSPCPSPYPNSETNADLPLHVEQYLNYLSLATHTPPLDPNRESAIVEFSAQTLKLLRFNGRERLKGGAREGEEREREGQEMVLKVIILTRYELPFTICATTCVAQTGVCLISVRPTMALLVLIVDPTQPTAVTESGPNSPSPNAEAHIIATAIAAFQTNNAKRSSRGLPPLDSMTVPGIVMHGTRPTFYFVPVTKELEESVLCGMWPENSKETKVVRCATVSEIKGGDLEQGMDDPGYRRLALEHLLAFKELAKDHWQKLFEGF